MRAAARAFIGALIVCACVLLFMAYYVFVMASVFAHSVWFFLFDFLSRNHK